MSARPSTALCGLLMVVAACTHPEIAAPTWDALELAEVETALEQPTGELAHLGSEALEEALAQVAPVLIDMARYLGAVVQIVAEVSAQQDPPTPGGGGGDPSRSGATGAQLFLELACPGSRLEPPFSFEQGHVRVDSPVLDSLADLHALLQGSALLLDFHSCELGEIVMEGPAPALFHLELEPGQTSPPEGFGVALDFTGLEYTDRVLPLGVMALGCAGAASCNERQAVSAQLLAGQLGSYTLGFVLTHDFQQSPTTLAIALVAADGEAQCVFDAQVPRVTCATSSAEPTSRMLEER